MNKLNSQARFFLICRFLTRNKIRYIKNIQEKIGKEFDGDVSSILTDIIYWLNDDVASVIQISKSRVDFQN